MTFSDLTPPVHGGRLFAAAQRFQRPVAEWIDLSAALNPSPYPVPALPASAWSRLPEEEDGLTAAMAAYYGNPHVLASAGSQAVIQALPRLLRDCRPVDVLGERVSLPSPRASTLTVAVSAGSYAEHAYQWAQAGHWVSPLHDWLAPEVWVVVHPDNPSGQRLERDTLLDRARQRSALNLLTVVDEAFIDATPEDSVAAWAGEAGYEHLIVLRSLGKFFGLAGLRVGAVLAHPAWLHRLQNWLGPWSINTPARHIARQALLDQGWQETQRAYLPELATRLQTLLSDAGLPPSGGCALFQWIKTPHAPRIAEHLAHAGILVREFSEPTAVRLGLPAQEDEWQRLSAALQTLPSDSRLITP